MATSIIKSSNTMTENLTIHNSVEAEVRVINDTTGVGVYLDNASSGNHGVWSTGYWNGSSFISSGKWLIYRNSAGDTIVNNKVTGTIGTHEYTSSTIDNVNTLFKANDIVYINLDIRGDNGMTFPIDTNLFTIPSGFRPSANVRLPALLHHKTADVWVGYFVTVTSAGKITQDWTSSCDGISISSFYML